MHELGHTLGLRHGGSDNVNCKPNYLSIMSYSMQATDIDPTRHLDYSRQALPVLFEFSLDEPLGVGGPMNRNTVYGVEFAGLRLSRVVSANGGIDWNFNLLSNELSVAADINYLDDRGCQMSPNETLRGHEDWNNLRYDFRTSADFADGVHLTVPGDPERTVFEILLSATQTDFDGDGRSNALDNCPAVFNPEQVDSDQDGIGESL